MPAALKQRFGKGFKVTANYLLGVNLLASNRVRYFSAMQGDKVLHHEFFSIVLFKKSTQYFYVGVLST